MSVRQLDKRPNGSQNSSYNKKDLDATEAHVGRLVQVPYLLLHDANIFTDVLDIRLQHPDILFPISHYLIPGKVLAIEFQ